MAYKIDFKELAEELRPEGSCLTYLGACLLTGHFLPEIKAAALEGEREHEMIKQALYIYDENIALRKEVLENDELKNKYLQNHEALQEIQNKDIESKLEEILSDCVKKQQHLLLYAVSQYMPLEGRPDIVLQNFVNFIEAAELTEDEGHEVLLLIEAVAKEGSVSEPELENVMKAKNAAQPKAEDEIKDNFQNNSDEAPSALKNKGKGYDLN